jgi:hypothetical protein
LGTSEKKPDKDQKDLLLLWLEQMLTKLDIIVVGG